MNTRKQRGFTLIEILISMSIVLLLTAIAAYSYSAATRAGQASAALQDMKLVNTTVDHYLQEFGPTAAGTNLTSMAALAYGATGSAPNTCPAAGPTAALACLVPNQLAFANTAGSPSTTKDGYVFALTYTSPSVWNVTAVPDATQTQSSKYFYIDQSGIARYAIGAAATASSTPVGS
jgi:prepilin-type N-terminal cleavage/methylation domain-containing protein